MSLYSIASSALLRVTIIFFIPLAYIAGAVSALAIHSERYWSSITLAERSNIQIIAAVVIGALLCVMVLARY